MITRGFALAAVIASVAAFSGCTPDNPVETANAAPPAATPAPAPAATPAAAAPPALTLPVSLNAVMVALVDHASEPLWLDSYQPPKTADRWREVEYNAYQMAVSGKLIQIAGTGPNDAGWAADPQFRTFADEMSAAGMDSLRAAQAKDVTALNKAGDRLVAACETCHKAFKPGLTSMGIYKSPNYPPK